MVTGAHAPGPGRHAEASRAACATTWTRGQPGRARHRQCRSEEHTSELQSLRHLVCLLLLEKKNKCGPARLCARHEGRRSRAVSGHDFSANAERAVVACFHFFFK